MHDFDYKVAGITINAVDLSSSVERFFSLVEHDGGGWVCVASSHGICAAQKDPELSRIMNSSSMSIPDGVPLAVVGRLQSRRQQVTRVPGPDFFETCLRDPRAKNARHFFYGGAPETVEAIAERAVSIVGPDAVVGRHSPPMRHAGEIEDADTIAAMQKADPTIVWVGLSTPKQEYFMHNHAKHFPNAVFVGIGAAFDFFANNKPRAPYLVRKVGMEWLFRLVSEPRRLWPRYRQVVPRMAGIMAMEFFHFATGRYLTRATSGGPPPAE